MSQPKITDTALDQYALTPPVSLFPLLSQGNSNTTIGVRTGASDFILKIYSGYDDPSRLKSEHELLAWLQQQRLSFAVPAPLRTKAGATMAFSGLGWQALTPFFPGSRVDPEHPRELESFGGALGELLSAFERYPLEVAYVPASEFHIIVPRLPDLQIAVSDLGLEPNRHNDALTDWLRHELAELTTFMKSSYQVLPRQLTHNDFIPSNVLYDHGRIGAVLDFEFVTPGIRGLDFAMALLFCLRYWSNPDPHETTTLLSRGYGRHNSLTAEEVQQLPLLLRLRNMASTLWWLGRALKNGDARSEAIRIERTREFTEWLGTYESRLTAAVASILL